MHHMFGKKSLIAILNSRGFYCTNDDLKYCLYLAAVKKLEENLNIEVPSRLIHKNSGGHFIKEGDDKVNINTETIDGENSYHSMVRIIF